jgi:uncharacterized cupin superfamily protein
VGLAHWNDVEPIRRAEGDVDATRQALGASGGSQTVSLTRVRVAPGMLSSRPHSHRTTEEIFFVLGGSGVALEGDTERGIRAGSCVVHHPTGPPHTFRARDEGLELLVFGTRGSPSAGGVVHFEDAELHEGEPGRERGLGSSAGSRHAGLHWLQLNAGRRGPPPHCHSEEEEIFVVLDGEATLELWPSPRTLHEQREDVPLRAGHVVIRPPASRVGHAFAAGPDGVTMLVYGTRKGNDIVYYQRSKKIFWRGVGLIGRVEALEYYDGEPEE